jgi:hypothetical protein
MGLLVNLIRVGLLVQVILILNFNKTRMCKSGGLILFLIAIGPVVWAQTDPFNLDNNTYDEKHLDIYEWYSHKQGKALQIFNGPEYIPVDRRIQGHPFFEYPSYQMGWIKYEGEIYIGIEMGYDIYREELAVVHYDENSKFSPIRLNAENVDGFSFKAHRFIRLEKDDNPNLARTGFYEVLHEGSLNVFAISTKKVQPSNDGPSRYQFVAKSVIYVFKDKEFHKIGSRKALLKLLEDEKSSIRKITKYADEDFGDFVVSVCKRYEELKQEGRK